MLLRVGEPMASARWHAASRRSLPQCPVEQSPGRPFQVLAVGVRHVLGERGVAPAQPRAQVGGDPPAVVETLNRGGGDAHLDLLLYQAVRDAAVVVTFGVDVVVDVDDRRLPFGEVVARGRQRLHRRAIDRLKGALAATLELFERASVELNEQCVDRGVELFETEELPVAQPRENPALHHEYARLHGRLVAGVRRARWQDRRAVMTGEIRVR